MKDCPECRGTGKIEEENNETIPTDIFCRIEGKVFRCPCGCNVFRKLKRDKTIYKCNACEELFQSE